MILLPVLLTRPLSDNLVSMVFMELCHIGGETLSVEVSTALLACWHMIPVREC